MSRIEFSWKPTERMATVPFRPAGIRLSDEVLGRNASWFISLRWYVVASLFVFQGVASVAGSHLARIGIVSEGYWLAAIASVLGAANIWYTLTIKRNSVSTVPPVSSPAINIWTQIVVDLVCLTIAVHFTGSLGTPAPFFYVLHIVLAGVFLSTETSIIVLFLVIIFYGSCLALEYSGIVMPQSVLISTARLTAGADLWSIILQGFAIAVLFVLVWYMVAQLSQIIRIRENQLIEADAQTQILQKEKDRYAVQMTHQLKSPLDAIRSNISLLVNGYCGVVPEESMQVLKKVDSRAKGMGELIIDVLKLSRVKSFENTAAMAPVDISAMIGECVENLRPNADKRNVTIAMSLEPAQELCFGEHLQMLFENLLTNAVSYSYPGGTVQVSCKKNMVTMCTEVVVSDKGIGIDTDKLPHIFDAYFRTKEASEFNLSSSGIGLAIVKQVAENHDLRLWVESELAKGTTVSVFFPAQVVP